MKNKSRKKKGLWEYKIKFIESEELNKLIGKNLSPEKLRLANERLKRIKSLPK